MRATIPYIQQKFDEFNRMLFDGRLPPIRVELSKATRFVGLCQYRKRRTMFGGMEYYDFRLRISTRFDLPENELEDIIIHEMIHYSIALDNIPDTSCHGRIFRRLMDNINANFGRNVTVSHRSTPEQRDRLYEGRGRYHVIAVVTFTNGRTGFKVLPRIWERILNYYNKVGRADSVHAIALYMSNNAFFERYPNSSTLTVHYIDREILETYLCDADIIKCDGRSLHVM